MKLNGWQRLWVFSSAPFTLLGVSVATYEVVSSYLLQEELPAGWQAIVEWRLVGNGLLLAIGWPLATYAVGWGVAWVRRGFREG